MTWAYNHGRKERRKQSRRNLELLAARYHGIAESAMKVLQRGFFGRLKFAFFRK